MLLFSSLQYKNCQLNRRVSELNVGLRSETDRKLIESVNKIYSQTSINLPDDVRCILREI